MFRNYSSSGSIDIHHIVNTDKATTCNSTNLESSVLPNTNGSAYVVCGDTKVLCGVNYPLDLKSDDHLFVSARVAPFARNIRNNFVTDDDSEIARAVKNALQAIVMVDKMPHSKAEVHIQVLNDDGALRAGKTGDRLAVIIAASVTCASIALQDAAVPLYDMAMGVPVLTAQGFIAGCVAVLPSLGQIAASRILDPATAVKAIPDSVVASALKMLQKIRIYLNTNR